jgi:hypothetical protein
MAGGAFVPLAFFIAIVGSVGFRLVRLWRKTRQLPEGSLGFGLVLLTCSMPALGVGRVPAIAMEPFGRLCFSLGLLAAALGLSLTVFFNYWVFRRNSPWARVLLWCLCMILGAAVAIMSAANFTGENITAIKQTMRPATLSLMGVVLVSFLWGSAESFLQRAATKRQLALGLGDPVIANRFLLWGIASLTCSLLMVVIIGFVLSGMTIMREPASLAALGAAGSIMSAAWYLTFFAPQSYHRFVRNRAAAESTTVASQ